MRQHDACEQCLVRAYTNASTGLPTKYENIPFDKPVDDSPWAAVWYMPNTPVGVTAGEGGLDEITGIFQIDLNYPLNSGTKAARDMANKVMDAFPQGHNLMYNDAWVRPRQIGRTQGREVDGWWRVSVTVVWYSRLQRLGA